MQRNVSQKNISKLLNPCLAENTEECIIYLFIFQKKLDFEPKTSISYIFPSFSLEPNQKPKKIPILTKQNWWFQIRVFENKKTRSTQQKPRKT